MCLTRFTLPEANIQMQRTRVPELSCAEAVSIVASVMALIISAPAVLAQEDSPSTLESVDGTIPVSADWIITEEDQRIFGIGDVTEIVRLLADSSAECTDPIKTRPAFSTDRQGARHDRASCHCARKRFSTAFRRLDDA